MALIILIFKIESIINLDNNSDHTIETSNRDILGIIVDITFKSPLFAIVLDCKGLYAKVFKET
jgi:hypothetical protein